MAQPRFTYHVHLNGRSFFAQLARLFNYTLGHDSQALAKFRGQDYIQTIQF